jgi:hypothetical protein
MKKHEVVVFKEYPLTVGQKIHIEDGLRRGDWLITGVTDKNIHLRCPVSGREVVWEKTFFFARVSVLEKFPGNL